MHVMITHTDLSDDCAVISKLRPKCWKWGEYDVRTIILWTQNSIIEVSGFVTEGRKINMFNIQQFLNIIAAVFIWLQMKEKLQKKYQGSATLRKKIPTCSDRWCLSRAWW